MSTDANDVEQTIEQSWVDKLGSRSWFRHVILNLFAIDLRTLALTRIVLASIVLIDLLTRLPDLKAFYTDEGVLPRAAVRETLRRSWFISIHFLNGSTGFAGAMFFVSAVMAILLLVGYRTRLASFCTWFLFSSLCIRSPFIVHGGDSVLKMLLFWGMLLPWGASYSVDAALNSNPVRMPKRILSFATAGILLQMPLVYFFTGILKNGPEWRTDLTAIAYTLKLPDFALPVGVWLSSYPGFLKFLTASTLTLEMAGAVLLFSPIRTRTVRFFICAAFVLFQLGLAITLRLELFPLVSTAALIPFISSSFWDRLAVRNESSTANLQVYYDANCGFCKRMLGIVTTFLALPRLNILPAQGDQDVADEMKRHNSWIVVDGRGQRHYEFDALIEVVKASPVFWFFAPLLRFKPARALGTWLYRRVAVSRGPLSSLVRPRRITVRQPLWLTLACGFFVVFVVVDSMGSVARSPLRIPARLAPIGQVLNIHQKWRMFAPSPLRSYTWYVVSGRLKNGREVELFTGDVPRWEKPVGRAPWIRNERWRTYMRFLLAESQRPLLPYFTGYACRRWNSQHAPNDAVESLTFDRVDERISLDGTSGEIQKALIWQQACGVQP